jgi:hypothetical protein
MDMVERNQHANEVATDAAITCESKAWRARCEEVGDIVTVTTDTRMAKP